nr:LysR substrate-binding domain-containing protein [Ruegeria arenilitoris]
MIVIRLLVRSAIRRACSAERPSNKGMQKLRLPGKLVMNQTNTYREALVRGLGIGLLPEIMATDLVEADQLEPINLTGQFPDVGVFAVYPEKAFQPRRVGLFLDHLRQQIKQHPA